MADYKLILPAMGEGIIEATITRWLVSRGQQVDVDQPVAEIATDKVDSEIPSPVKGTIKKLVYREGEIPRVGEIIAIIETTVPIGEDPVFNVEQGLLRKHMTDENVKRKKAGVNFNAYSQNGMISPLIRSLAQQRGITASELESISGSGPEGSLTRNDLVDYAHHRMKPGISEKKATPVINSQNNNLFAGDEMVEMSRMRKLIAEHMNHSKSVAAHVTSFLEADITALVAWREHVKAGFFEQEKVKLTFTPVFVEAVADALKQFPLVNISVSGESIIVRKNINIGVATALADGNLIVPVIKNADRENIAGLAAKINDLASRARTGNLHPEEIKGGTFTITNIGQYNSLTGTPIINQPESAIMAFGTIMKKPWAVKTPAGYGIAVRDIIMLSLTYDHRVIDGALGGSFLSRVAGILENFDTTRKI